MCFDISVARTWNKRISYIFHSIVESLRVEAADRFNQRSVLDLFTIIRSEEKKSAQLLDFIDLQIWILALKMIT